MLNRRDDIAVFGGSASPRLAAAVAAELGVSPEPAEVERFPDGNVLVRTAADVEGRRCVVIQSTVFPADAHLLELAFWLDALRRGGAASVTAAIPYFGHGKADRRDEPGGAIRARVCADLLESAGATRIVTFDLHSPQVQGFFRVPLDELSAAGALAAGVDLGGAVVVAPDLGAVKRARRFAELAGAPLAVVDKRRVTPGSADVVEVIGSVAGRRAVIVDDFVLTGGTIAAVAQRLRADGAVAVEAAVTHGLIIPYAMERLEAAGVERLTITDSVENQPAPLSARVEVVSVAPLLADALGARARQLVGR